MRIPCFVILLTIFSSSSAQSVEDTLKKQSKLAISAFECAVVAIDAAEHGRLFTMGYKNGKAFMDTLIAKPQLWPKISHDVAILWRLTSGPTPDFVLGRVYAGLETDIYKKYDSNEERWKAIREGMFREKNCGLL